MGVTIHFEGHVRDQESVRELVKRACALGQAFGWPSSLVDEPHTTITRVIDEEDVPYTGPTQGVELWPHDDCDPIRLELGSDLFVQDYVKTQFAGAETHVRVIELLREIQPCFTDLEVFDEAEFWDTQDHDLLRQHIADTNAAIDDYVRDRPNAQVKVRLPSGKIADIVG